MKPLLAANWKMNLSGLEAETLARTNLKLAATFDGDLWIAPPMIWVDRVAKLVHGSKVELGAQNICWADNGAFTGEVSVSMLKEVGCSFAIVGHSERRHLADEGEMLCRKRCSFALSCGFKVIFCIGETQADRQNGATGDVIASQLKGLNLADENLIIAYEPVWAIGTGVVASRDQIAKAVEQVGEIAQNQGHKVPRVLYGGSVTQDNIKMVLSIPSIGGALVGGASIDPSKLTKLLEATT